MEKNKPYEGVITEQGDLGLGYTPITEENKLETAKKEFAEKNKKNK